MHKEQVLLKDGIFQWKRLENLVTLASYNDESQPSIDGVSKSTYEWQQV